MTIEQRMAKHVDRSGGPEACWPWQASTTRGPFGYGQIGWNGKMWLAHRVAYWLAFGPFAPELCVLHRCDNPPCCNPDHLFLGTRKDNAEDMVNKGRYTQHRKRYRGMDSKRAKLTDDEIREIRDLYASGRLTQTRLAERFNTSQSNISVIVLRQHWAHLA